MKTVASSNTIVTCTDNGRIDRGIPAAVLKKLQKFAQHLAAIFQAKYSIRFQVIDASPKLIFNHDTESLAVRKFSPVVVQCITVQEEDRHETA